VPKSQLLRALVRLANDHREAEERGVPVATVRAERAGRPSGLSRRSFLAAAGAGATALALPRLASAAPDKNPRVVIIGGGISGLSAALTLADANLTTDITLFEAKNRLGGRMYSNGPALGPAYWDDGQVTEWCGELVDSGHATVRGLCKRYGLPLDDLAATAPQGSTPVYWFGGAYYPFDQVDTDFAPVFTAVQSDANASIPAKKSDGSNNVDGTVLWDAITPAAVKLDNTSVYDWIEQKVPKGHKSRMGKLLDLAYTSEYGADTKDQSSLNLVLLLSGLSKPKPFFPFGASDERYHIRGGNQQLPLAIAADLKKRLGSSFIQMNSRLTKIAKNADGSVAVTIATTAGGKTTTMSVDADAVILTLPFTVLADKVDFSGAMFDARKTQSIKELGRGLCSKLQLQFKDRMWTMPGPWGSYDGEEVFSDNGDQCSWHVTRAQPGTTGILNGYTGGTPTVERAKIANVSFGKVNVGSAGKGIAKLATTFLAQLEEIFPGVTAEYNGKATLSLPHVDEDFRLAYSFWKVGQYQAFAGYERTPQGNIFFGGEHTSVDFQGYMEGGASEGVRAGQEVIAAAKAGTLVQEPMSGSSDSGGCGCVVAPGAAEAPAWAAPMAIAAGLALARARSRGEGG
jgi:monoamine oxidase